MAERTFPVPVESSLKYKSLGTFSTEAGLSTALNTEISAMNNDTQKAVKFIFSSAVGSFSAVTYQGILSRGSSADYGSLFVEAANSQTDPHSVNGSKNLTWGYTRGATQGQIDALNDKIIPKLKPTTRNTVLRALNTDYTVTKDAWFRLAMEANGTDEMRFIIDGQLTYTSRYNGIESHLVPLAKGSVCRFESSNNLQIGSTALQILM